MTLKFAPASDLKFQVLRFKISIIDFEFQNSNPIYLFKFYNLNPRFLNHAA